MRYHLFLLFFLFNYVFIIKAGDIVSLKNNGIELQWKKQTSGYVFDKILTNFDGKIDTNSVVDACQTIVFLEEIPENVQSQEYINYGVKTEIRYFELVSTIPLKFSATTKYGKITTQWDIVGNNVMVKQVFTAYKTGYYAVSTQNIFNATENELKWATVPGYLHANEVSSNYGRAYNYGHFIPNIPVVYKDKCVTTPVAILSKEKVTIGIVPEADYPRKPHDINSNTHTLWNVGFSMLNLQDEISPTLYYPVFGSLKSKLNANQSILFDYRYIISNGNWFDVFKQAVYNVFEFKKFNIVQNKEALTMRILRLYAYLSDTKTSKFRLVNSDGLIIGAHDYMGKVANSNNDAMKNSDYGAMWMLGKLTQDPILLNDVLPYARNFKIKQQYLSGSFIGAVKGQYYLWKSKTWVEEWGPNIEPMGVTYYAISDLANILLFNPNDNEAKTNIRLAAEYLFNVQKTDGSWNVGIDKNTGEVIYPDLEDLRPTFYGMLIAYKILGDEKYLNAAIKGADWFVENAVNKGQFIGVCGDTRFSPDFATAQAAQVLLDMYETTRDDKYKIAAIKTAEFYTTYIYTYPNGQTDMQTNVDQTLPGWAFTQSGLCIEHGGAIGSAATRGPILLASFAPLFVRMFALTNDSIYIDMARAAANGRDAFIDPTTGVASYYWDSFNEGPGPFPHHAWWQIGWIMDYLVAEAELRSKGDIVFPRGFITPKVGPHKSLGFCEGSINNKKVSLCISKQLVKISNPLCEWLTAVGGDTLFVVLLNSSKNNITVPIGINGKVKDKIFQSETQNIQIEPFGIKILEYKDVTSDLIIGHSDDKIDVTHWRIADFLHINSSELIQKVIFFNSNGLLVKEINNNNSNTISINIKSWTKGVYIYRVKTQNGGVVNRKFIVI